MKAPPRHGEGLCPLAICPFFATLDCPLFSCIKFYEVYRCNAGEDRVESGFDVRCPAAF